VQDERDLPIPAYGVHSRTGVDLEQLLSVLRDDGWPVYVLSGAANDEDSFFEAVRGALPLDRRYPATAARGMRCQTPFGRV
jgi:hypothetical protein